jgi:hypothetical protein
MNRRRSRLALLGVLALALSVTVGMTAGVAEAKKKGKKKGGNSVTVTAPPTVIPAASGGIGSLTDIPLRVGKKAKGKTVSFNTVELTAAFSGLAGFLTDLEIELVNPRDRSVALTLPFDDETTTLGPLTWTPNSHFGLCPSTMPVPNPCPNPKFTIIRPYIGRASFPELAFFGGTRAAGTWHLLVVNTAAVAVQLTLLRLLIELDQPQEDF